MSKAKHYWPEEIVGTGELVVYLSDYAALEAECERLRELVGDYICKINEDKKRLVSQANMTSAARRERDTLRQQLAERDAIIERLETGIPRIQEQSHQMRQQRDKLAEILRDIVPGCKWKHMRPRIDAALAEIDHDNE